MPPSAAAACTSYRRFQSGRHMMLRACANIAPQQWGSAHVLLFRRVLRYWAIALLIATAMTLFTGFQTNMQFALRGSDMRFFDSAVWSLVIWFTWAFLAPV